MLPPAPPTLAPPPAPQRRVEVCRKLEDTHRHAHAFTDTHTDTRARTILHISYKVVLGVLGVVLEVLGAPKQSGNARMHFVSCSTFVALMFAVSEN